MCCVFARNLFLAQETLRLVLYFYIIEVAPDIHAHFPTAEHAPAGVRMQPFAERSGERRKKGRGYGGTQILAGEKVTWLGCGAT